MDNVENDDSFNIPVGTEGTPDNNFETQLSPEEEDKFSVWKDKFAPNDTGEDYDLRGAFKAGFTPSPDTGHWPDVFKKPNHPTFSDQSIYAKYAPQTAGHWKDNLYIPSTKPSEDEETLRLGAVMHGEMTGKSNDLKKMVGSSVLNRYEDGRYGATMDAVMQKKRLLCYKKWRK
jgi:hypothetical protein